MKYENLFKIHIPEPCGEDWDKMTPNELGAYCKVCQKTVVDFSGKSDEDIQKYLLDNENQKVCGRFRSDQLDDRPKKLKIELPKFEFPSYLLPVITPFRVAALSLMLFASVALTSCGNSDGEVNGEPKIERLAGAVEMVVDSSNVKDSTCNINENVNDDERLVAGKLKVREDISVDTLKTDTSEIKIKGEIEPRKTHGVLIKKP